MYIHIRISINQQAFSISCWDDQEAQSKPCNLASPGRWSANQAGRCADEGAAGWFLTTALGQGPKMGCPSW